MGWDWMDPFEENVPFTRLYLLNWWDWMGCFIVANDWMK